MIKKTFKFFHKNRIFYYIPLLFMIPLINSFLIKDIDVILEANNFPIYSYSDTSTTNGDGDNGNSVVTQLERKNGKIYFTYELGEVFSDRYAGFIIDFKSTPNQYLDFSKYDNLILNLNPKNSNALQPIIMTHSDGFTIPQDPMTNRFFIFELDLLKDKNKYKIPLKDIKTPMWWHELNKTTETTMGNDDFSKVVYMKIESGTITPVNEPQSIEIDSIIVSKDRIGIALFTLLITSMYFFIYWLWIFLLKKLKTPVIIPYEKLKIINHGDRDLNSVVEVIAKDYNKSELSINDIADKTGLTTVKISTLLQDKFSTPFKLYLNSIRIAEAKRLLKESDRQISEIAFIVGYKNPTHFNRIFKQLNQMTPKQYRMAHLS